jgi:hypothetical protein
LPYYLSRNGTTRFYVGLMETESRLTSKIKYLY